MNPIGDFKFFFPNNFIEIDYCPFYNFCYKFFRKLKIFIYEFDDSLNGNMNNLDNQVKIV